MIRNAPELGTTWAQTGQAPTESPCPLAAGATAESPSIEPGLSGSREDVASRQDQKHLAIHRGYPSTSGAVRTVALLRASLLPPEVERTHHRGVGMTEQDSGAVAGIDVLVDHPGGHHEHVLILPVKAPAVHN
jgi:hypothetical protein